MSADFVFFLDAFCPFSRGLFFGLLRILNIFLKLANKDFPSGSVVKNPPVNTGDTSLISSWRKFHMPRGNESHVPQLLSLRSRAV